MDVFRGLCVVHLFRKVETVHCSGGSSYHILYVSESTEEKEKYSVLASDILYTVSRGPCWSKETTVQLRRVIKHVLRLKILSQFYLVLANQL